MFMLLVARIELRICFLKNLKDGDFWMLRALSRLQSLSLEGGDGITGEHLFGETIRHCNRLKVACLPAPAYFLLWEYWVIACFSAS